MATETDRRHVPDVLLERYRLGELSASQARDVEARLAGDAGSRHRLDALEAEDAAQRAAGLPHRLATAVRERQRAASAPARSPAWRTLGVAGAAASVLVAVVATLVRPPAPPVTPASDDADRIKGAGPAIVVFRKAGSASEPLHDGDTAHPRDVVRLGYVSAGRAYGVIVSLDGRGAVTQHLPSTGTAAVALAPNGRVLLDNAYELDDAPRWERFCLATGTRPFEVGPVLDAARAAARAGAASFTVPSLDVTCLTLRKD